MAKGRYELIEAECCKWVKKYAVIITQSWPAPLLAFCGKHES